MATSLSSVSVKNSGGNAVALTAIAMPDGSFAPIHIVCDANGAPISATNPLLTAPGLLAAAGAQRNGVVATAGAVVLAIAANATRKGGSIRAGSINKGALTVTVTNADGSTFTQTLQGNDTFSFTVNPGYVLTGAVTVAGDTPTDTFEGVEYT